MADLFPVVQLVLSALSLPLVTGLGAWLLDRLSKERRLLAQVERLSSVYPNLPDGTARNEFAERVREAVTALNVRLDPLFRVERRRKRVVVMWMACVVVIVALAATGLHINNELFTSICGVLLGGIAMGAFWLIERDTKRQRMQLEEAAKLHGARGALGVPDVDP